MPDGLALAGVPGTGAPGTGAPVIEQAGPRSDRATLLGFVNDAQTEATLREGLAGTLKAAPELRRANIHKAILALQRGASASTLVVDVSGEEQPLAALADLAQVVEPNVTVLVVGDRQDLDFYRRITRGMGVREYLFKPLTAEMVARHFGSALDGRDDDAVLRGGRVLAVIGARAGAGVSTIATNLAWYLGEQVRRHTVLVDADLRTGTAAMMLGARATPALRNAMETPERLDALYVERAVQAVGPRLDVLASEDPLDLRPTYAAGAAGQLIDLLKRDYNFIIIDLPIGQSQIAREFRASAHQSVLVLDPTLPAVRDTLRLLALAAPPRHVGRPLLVLNRAGAPGGLTAAQVEEALRLAPTITIPDLGRRVREAELSGQPAASLGGGPLRDAIATIARQGAGVHSAAPRRRWLSWMVR
jgi:pilus assembly protein CpaE